MLVRIYILILLLFKVGYCVGQPNRFTVQSYGLQQGMLQTTITDATFDALNFMWVGYPNGIQKFNGIRFLDVPVQQGLPDTKWARFFRLSTQHLLVAHAEGISLYDINRDKFIQIFKNAASDNQVPEFIGERNGVLWFYSKKLGVNGLHVNSYKARGFTSFENILGKKVEEVYILSQLHQNGIVLNAGNVFHLWDPEQGKEIARVNVGFSFFGNRNASYLMPNQKVQFYSKKDAGAYVLSFADKSVKKVFKGSFAAPLSIRAFYKKWQSYALVAFQNRVFYFNEKQQTKGLELLNINGVPVIEENGIQQILVDNYHNLYFRTTSGGFKKIAYNNTAIAYYGGSQKRYNYTLCILPDKKANCILVGTRESGLLIYDTLQRKIGHLKTKPNGQQLSGLNAIVKVADGSYLLYCVGESKAWRLHPDLKSITPLPSFKKQLAIPAISYFNSVLQNGAKKVLTYSEGRLISYHPELNMGSVHFFSKGVSDIATLYKGRLVLQKENELLLVDTATKEIQQKVTLNGTGGVRSFAQKDGDLYIGTNKGIFIINKTLKLVKQYNAASGLPDECIYAMIFDKAGRLWFSTNKGVFCIKNDESIFQLTVEDGLQDNEFNTGVVAATADGELYFGGVNGVSSFYPDVVLAQQQKMKLLVTDIRVANKPAVFPVAAWNVKQISLPWDRNVLSFDFLAMGQKGPSQYIHQYKMEGVDKEWRVNKDLQTVRYHLPPGRYTFNIFASTSYVASPAALQKIAITIHPPFYSTWWFIGLMAVLLLFLLVFIINGINKRKHQNALRILQEANRIQLERERISRDLHDNIGLHANTILYNTELLESQKLPDEIMNSLRFAAKDIIASLRETVWAFKKETYSAEECLLRLRNYVQVLDDYHPQIVLKVIGKAPRQKTLSHSHALNLVLMVQEAITNAIKHANASIIIVHSIDSQSWEIKIEDNGKGFDTNRATYGNGLENLGYRANESKFDLTIYSNTAGTMVNITIH